MRHLKGKKIAVLGAGTLGEALIRGLLEGGEVRPRDLWATTGTRARVREVMKRHAVRGGTDSREACRRADVVILAVKPKALDRLLEQVKDDLREGAVVVSVVASATTAYVEERLPRVPVVRAMPNTPCLVGEGMTALASGKHARRRHVAVARAVFEAVGRCVEVDEALMDAVTGLSASGPAFLYVVIESLAEGGVKMGVPRQLATELVAQTALGAAKMVLETHRHPALLKDMVTTPAGCTVDGLMELEDGGLRVALIKAVMRATERAGELLEDNAK